MNKSKRALPVTLLIVFISLIFLVIAAKLIIDKSREEKQDIDIFGEVPPFTFTERNGQSFGRENFVGKISVVDFIYTTCPSVCPIMTNAMNELYNTFKVTDKIQFVSITVDPEHDTLEVLQKYAKRIGVTDNRWVFLHAPVEQVKELSEKGFMFPAGNLPDEHSRKFALVDQDGMIRGYFDSFDTMNMALLKLQISKLYYKEKEKAGGKGFDY